MPSFANLCNSNGFSFHHFHVCHSYWDPAYDQALMHNSIALNLLYILTLSDIDRGWIMTTPEIGQQLNELQAKGNKKEVYNNELVGI